MKYLLRGIILAGLLVLMLPTFVFAQDTALAETPEAICDAETPADEPESREYAETEAVLEVGVDYYAIFCTDAGAIYIDLLEDTAPLTVNNFVFLANNGYYNNTIFHRVIENFMAQGGDPTGTGRGGPGYQFRDEAIPFMTFDRPGLLAMANAGAGTNGSQFFITTTATPHLNYKHTIFGTVVNSQANVDNILLRDPSVADAPATLLETVIIITDASTVDGQNANSLDAVAADVIVEGLGLLNAATNMPEDLQAGFIAPEVIATEAVPEVIADSGHVYRVTTTIGNAQCSEQYFFESLGYTVDLLDSPQSVASLLMSDAFATWHEENGFVVSANTLGFNIYQIPPAEAASENTENCSADATTLRVYLQRGQYLVTIDLVTSASQLAEVDPSILIDLLALRIPQIFEVGLDTVYSTPIQ